MWLLKFSLLVSIVPLVSAWPTNTTHLAVSKIPLKNFGQFASLTLEEAIDHAQPLASTSSVDDTSSNAKFAAPAIKLGSSSQSSCTSPRTRIEWRSYSSADREAFVNSISCLTKLPSAGATYSPSTSRYEDFVQTHQKMTSSVHGNGVFLLWHRYFVYLFEQALRSECGFDSAMPWWDETLDSGKFQQSSLFTASYFGSLPGPTDGRGTCVPDGKFANLTLHIGPGTNNVEHCLSRAVNETMTAQSSTAYINYCAEQSVYGDFASCAETGPHAWAHNGIGSVMSDVYASPSDPIFFMHHLFVDAQFASWQEANSSRASSVADSCVDGSNPCATALTTKIVLDMNGLGANATVGDIVNTQGGAFCYRYDYYY